jgi:hypothetical protein
VVDAQTLTAPCDQGNPHGRDVRVTSCRDVCTTDLEVVPIEVTDARTAGRLLDSRPPDTTIGDHRHEKMNGAGKAIAVALA